MDYAKALTYMLEDDDILTKAGIGSAIMLVSIPLLGIPMIFMVGYLIAIARNVKKGVEKPLPAWDDWGGFFREGINVIVIYLGLSSPFLLLTCAFVALMVAGGVITENGAENLGGGLMLTAGLIYSCISLIWAFLYIFISHAAMVLYLRHGSIGACFNMSDLRAIASEQAGNIFIITLVVMGASMAISTVFSMVAFIPCIGWILAFVIWPLSTVYTIALQGHLLGQLARQVDGKTTAEAW